jgi:hypothetical protein
MEFGGFMKRRITSLAMIFVLICFFGFNINSVKGLYGVTVGEIYNYELIMASQNLTYGDHFASSRGIYAWDYTFNEGAILTYEITNVSDLSAEFNFSSGSFDMSLMTIEWVDLNLILMMSFQVISLVESYNLDPWNQTIWERGINLPYMSPFLEISNDTWDEITNIDQYLSSFCDDISGQDTIIYQFSEFQTDEILEVETYIEGDILGSIWGVNAEVTLSNQLKFVFNTETGVLQGIHVKAFIKGDYFNYEDLEISYEYHIELVGYDLNDFSFSEVHVVGNFGELTIIGTITFMCIIILIKYKKKNRNY